MKKRDEKEEIFVVNMNQAEWQEVYEELGELIEHAYDIGIPYIAIIGMLETLKDDFTKNKIRE